MATPPPMDDERVHREIIKLAVLAAMAVAAFVGTRALAAHVRDENLRDATAWYAIGREQLEAGHVEDAIAAFRRARLKNRTQKAYGLALAGALARAGQDAAAVQTLLVLRESAPEDPEINLQLARLAAERADVSDTVRYYRNALYGPWTDASGPRAIRLELIDFLLREQDRPRALAELLAATADTPDDPPANTRYGRLFLAAGDPQRALDQFERAITIEPRNTDALVGAGMAAFRLGRYTLARNYLRQAPEAAADAQELREIATLVLTHDPLAGRLGAAERRRRLLGGLAHARERLATCAGASDRAGELETLQREIQTRRAADRDVLETGVDLLYQVGRAIESSCPLQPIDRAWLLIGERHGAGAAAP